jgi:hypothetical protein
MKTRYAKPFEGVQVKIPYETGMDPYSGLIEMFEKAGLLKKSGNRLEYTSKRTGEVIIEFRKNWTGDKLDTVMEDLILGGEVELSSEDTTDIVVEDNIETVTEE